MTTKSTPLFSDLAIPPGEVLEEELEERGMTQEELADKMGCPPQVIAEIIRADEGYHAGASSRLGESAGH